MDFRGQGKSTVRKPISLEYINDLSENTLTTKHTTRRFKKTSVTETGYIHMYYIIQTYR